MAFASVQKGFAIPPGLAVAAVSNRAVEKSKNVPGRGYYFNFELWAKSGEKNQTLVTPNIPHIMAVNYQCKKLLAEAVDSMRPGSNSTDKSSEPDWPRLYAAILKLKPEHQTIVTLRFFENLQYEQISQILNVKVATLRVTLHRILERLRKHLKTVMDGEA